MWDIYRQPYFYFRTKGLDGSRTVFHIRKCGLFSPWGGERGKKEEKKNRVFETKKKVA